MDKIRKVALIGLVGLPIYFMVLLKNSVLTGAPVLSKENIQESVWFAAIILALYW